MRDESLAVAGSQKPFQRTGGANPAQRGAGYHRRGKKVVVMLSYEEYRRLTAPQRNLAQFLLQSPLAGSGLTIEADQSLPREVDVQQ